MDWEPARADHSIDRATAQLDLQAPLDADTFDELIIAARRFAAEHNLTNRLDLTDPIEVPAGAGALFQFGPENAAPRRVVFRRMDSEGIPVEELSIAIHRITISTIRYNRWIDFFRLIERGLIALTPVAQNTRIVRLQYVDRFQSIPGGADHFEVIDRASRFLTPAVADKAAALHIHSGWFDLEPNDLRRLTNVNIDVQDISLPPPPDPRRKIAILTLGQIKSLAGPLDNPLASLAMLHDYLKALFSNIITQDAANRVALND